MDQKKLTTRENAIRNNNIWTPASPPYIWPPGLFQWRTVDPEKHGRHAKKEIHRNHSKPEEYPRPAVNAVPYKEQRNGERRLAPRLAADGQRDGDLADEVHVVEILTRYLPRVFSVSQVDGHVGAYCAAQKCYLWKVSISLSQHADHLATTCPTYPRTTSKVIIGVESPMPRKLAVQP